MITIKLHFNIISATIYIIFCIVMWHHNIISIMLHYKTFLLYYFTTFQFMLFNTVT